MCPGYYGYGRSTNSEALADCNQFGQFVRSAGDALAAFNQKVPNALYGLPATYFAGIRLISPDQQTQFGAVTKRLDVLTGFEIQIDPYECHPNEVAKHLYGMVGYILANGQVFADGNTIGIEESKNFRMRKTGGQEDQPTRWIMTMEIA